MAQRIWPAEIKPATDSQDLGTYYCFLPMRDGERTIGRTLESLVNQTYMPSKIIVVNDGSMDGTGNILQEYVQLYPGLVEVINTGSATRDYKRIPLLWNMSLRKGYDYHMIAAGDVSFSPDYSEEVLLRMKDDPGLVVCSGDYGEMKSSSPHGAGRFVRQSFFYDNYTEYPYIVGYESEILERAMMKGHRIMAANDVTFVHLDRLGHSHNFSEFGYAMRSLGYYPLYAILRCCMDFCCNESVGRKGALRMLRYYLSFRPARKGYYSKFPDDIRSAIRERQKNYVKALARRALRRYVLRRVRPDISKPAAQSQDKPANIGQAPGAKAALAAGVNPG